MGRLTGSLVVSLLVMCCVPGTPPPPDVPDAPSGPDDTELDYCPAACTRWIALGCGEAMVCTRFEEPSGVCVENITCDEWCRRIIVEASEGVQFHPRCVAMTEPSSSVSDTCAWLDEACAGAAP